jgi:tetratricopeptide (TPR) repeat protein
MSSIRPGPNSHQGMGGPPPQAYGGPALSQQRANGYQMSSIPPSGPPPPHAPPQTSSPSYPSANMMKQLADTNVAVWMDIGRIAETMEDYERAKTAYEMAIKHNHDNLAAKKALALLFKDKLKSNDKVRFSLKEVFLTAGHRTVSELFAA